MKGPTRSPGIRRAIAQAVAIGYAVHFVEFVPSGARPAIVPPQGLCDRVTRTIWVGLRDLAQPGMPTCSRAKLLAVLEHELEHAQGKDRATDRPEFGLRCGGMIVTPAGTPSYAFAADDDEEPEPVKRRYRAFLTSVPGMYAQYDGHVDVWCATDDWDDVFREAVAELRRTSFPERSAACWRMEDFQLIR